ncbi:hypothetical protein [Aquipuribacter nitratireducens]|uniref:Adhesin domain-containing protein n=1 Tax=Aquipuribacter nitratireducens TaxID=650104 RepID=A0ABW0GL71_9MICO
MTTPTQQPVPPVPPAPRPPQNRPRVPWWAWVLTVLGVLVVVVVVGVAAAAALVAAGTREQRQVVDAEGVRELHVVGDVAGVRLRTAGAGDGEVLGDAVLTTSWVEGEVTVTREGDTLVLESECPSSGWPRRCDVGYDLVVDPEVDVDVDVATGGVDASGLAGDLTTSISAGGVSLRDATSQRVSASVTTGGVQLDFVAPPREVRVATSVGGVAVVVPDDGTAYDVSTGVSVGDAAVGITDEPGASRVLDLSATVGGIDVSYEGQDRGTAHERTWRRDQ